MTNDKEVYDKMKQLKSLVDSWITEVDALGNQNASTDRRLEKAIEVSKEIEQSYEAQFKIK